MNASGSGFKDLWLSRKFLFEKMKSSGYKQISTQINFLKLYIAKRTNCPKSKCNELHKTLSHFASDFKKKWFDSNRKVDRFLSKHNDWLQTSICFTVFNGDCPKQKQKVAGRPRKKFGSLSHRRKRQITENLRALHSSEQLSYATQMALRSEGKVEVSKLVKDVTSDTSQASQYKTALKKLEREHSECREFTPTEALSMYVDAKLTRHQYDVVRSNDKKRFPSYKKIQKAKLECYPEKEHVVITETSAEVRLQALLNHTSSRLLQTQRTVLEEKPETVQDLHLISKWGFDGSSGHSEYKQKFLSGVHTDASVFLSSLVPLRLLSGDPEKEHVVVWQNQRCSSTRFCRPIRFQFTKETTEIAKAERDYIEDQIRSLSPTLVEIDSQSIQVKHKLLFTMVDGKVCNSLTETRSTQKCYLCGLTSKDFNNLEKVNSVQVYNSRMYFGLSVLHAWIRFFECVLHLSYKIPINQWQARGEENKKIVLDTKADIQAKFKSELGLIVDKPKPGFGNSNDGNTARRFFDNASVSANITGVDKSIIERFGVILKAIASEYQIDSERFKEYCLETAALFVKSYPWNPMPPTVHKVLIHGAAVIENALLPIGQLSEEAQEARNKEFKNYRQFFSRKISREATNTDILNSLLISSDPVISSMRRVGKKSRNLDKSVLMLLKAPQTSACSTDDSTGSSSEEFNE